MCEDDGCCRSFAKVLLIIVNIIFLLGGLLMLALGISLVVAPEKVIQFAMSNGVNFDKINNISDGFFIEIVKACGIFMIILGGVVAIVAFLGFIGACCESQCLLVTYAIILIIIVLAEVALIIFAAVYPTTFVDSADDLLVKTIDKYGPDAKILANGTIDYAPVSEVAASWIAIQTTFNCCGSANNTDFMKSKPWDDANDKQIPLSCCKLQDGIEFPYKKTDYKNVDKCQANPTDATVTYQIGCATAINDEARNLLKKYGSIAIGIAAGIVGLELIMITLAFLLCCMRKRSSKYV